MRRLSVVLIPLALILGIWLGGHPSALPRFARDAFVSDSAGRQYDEALNTLEHDYFRPVDGDKLLDTSLGAAVASLQDQFSHYFSPRDYTSFQLDTEGRLEGVGMSVSTVKRGLKVQDVFKGSPAQKGGLKVGDIIVSVNGRKLAGTTSDQATTLIKGRVGTTVLLGVLDGAKIKTLSLKRAQVDIPVVESKIETYHGVKYGWVALSGFTEGAHGDVSAAVQARLKDGAKGIVLDLRDNGGGLLNEAVQIASIFIPDGRIVSTKGRARPEQVYNATGGAIARSIPVVVLVNENSASASEIVTGALQDRKRAKVVGTRTYGKGVFQEIERLSNGGALDITVGEYFTPVRAQPGRRRRAQGRRHHPGHPGPGQSQDDGRRGSPGGAEGAGVRVNPVVAVVEPRGAVGFFERGNRIQLDRGARVKVGDLVLVAPVGGRGAHGKVLRRIGRPDVARDVLEALMLHRGLRRRFDPLVEREAREAAPPVEGRRDLRSLATFTIDPPAAKDYDDAISAEALDDGAVRVWVHIADVSAFVTPGSALDREAFRRGTSVYVPGLVEPMLPEALSNRACSLLPGEDRLTVTVELEFEGARVRRTAFHRSLIRSDARLDYPRVDRVFAGAEPAEAPWAEPLAAARRVAAALASAREARGALAVESVEPEFAFSRDGHVTELEPSAQTEAHTLIEHLMIAANEAVARRLEASRRPALYRVHEPPDPPRVERLFFQLAALDVPTPPMAEHLTPQQAGTAVAAAALAVDAEVRRRGHGRAAFTTLVLRALKQAHYTPRNLGHFGLRSRCYCHFTSPIRRYPDVICHRALLAAIGAGEDAPRASDVETAGEWCSARERDAMAIERAADNVARAFLLEAGLFERGWQTEFSGEVTGLIGAGAFVSFDGFEGMLPVRRLGGDWWELDETETALVATDSGKRLRLGDPVVVQVAKVDAPRGRVDLSPVEA